MPASIAFLTGALNEVFEMSATAIPSALEATALLTEVTI